MIEGSNGFWSESQNLNHQEFYIIPSIEWSSISHSFLTVCHSSIWHINHQDPKIFSRLTKIEDHQTCRYRLKSAGKVFFLARSPDAPSTIMERDPISGTSSISFDKDSLSMLDLFSLCHFLDPIYSIIRRLELLCNVLVRWSTAAFICIKLCKK